jgi:hypothetical protein
MFSFKTLGGADGRAHCSRIEGRSFLELFWAQNCNFIGQRLFKDFLVTACTCISAVHAA